MTDKEMTTITSTEKEKSLTNAMIEVHSDGVAIKCEVYSPTETSTELVGHVKDMYNMVLKNLPGKKNLKEYG